MMFARQSLRIAARALRYPTGAGAVRAITTNLKVGLGTITSERTRPIV